MNFTLAYFVWQDHVDLFDLLFCFTTVYLFLSLSLFGFWNDTKPKHIDDKEE